MKNKINIAELLKDCPKGMELDCTMFEGVTFNSIVEQHPSYPIKLNLKSGETQLLTTYGCFNHDESAKCVIFPKGKTTWEGFQRPFKDRDVPYIKSGKCYLCAKNLFNEFGNIIFHKGDTYYSPKDGYLTPSNSNVPYKVEYCADEYFYTHEAKTSIKPWFKVGDRIKLKKTPTNNILTVTKTNDDGSLNVNTYSWVIKYELQDQYELVPNNQPKFKVGDRIKHKDSNIYCTLGEYSEGISAYRTSIGLSLTHKDLEQWELFPNKFDINTLIPFESKVLVRDNKTEVWKPAYWGFYDETSTMNYPYETVGGNCFGMCIPYEGNEHLVGTIKDCDDYYKTWKI